MCNKTNCPADKLTAAALDGLNQGALKSGHGGARDGAGRPHKKGVKRCACKIMTLKRAKSRGHKCNPILATDAEIRAATRTGR